MDATVCSIFGRPFVKWFALCYRSVVLSVLSVCDVRALWPNSWTDQDAIWYGCGPQPRGLYVRWRPSPPPQKGGEAPKFSAHIYCGQMAEWIKMPLGTMVGLNPGDSVLDGDPARLPTKRWSPLHNFWPISIVAKRLDASRCHVVWR